MDYDHNPYRVDPEQELARLEEADMQLRDGNAANNTPLKRAIDNLRKEYRRFTFLKVREGMGIVREEVQQLFKKYKRPGPRPPKEDDCWDECGHPPPIADDCTDQIYWMARLGTRIADVTANNVTELVLTPTNVEEFVPRQFLVAAFDTGTSTPNLNGSIEAVSIKGDNQLAGGSIAFSEFDRHMPFLRVNWRAATPQNPIVIRLQHHNTTTNADIQVVVAGDAKK